MPFVYTSQSGGRSKSSGFRTNIKYNSFTGYVYSATTKLPIYGTGGASFYPPASGWVGLINATTDDSFVQVNLPFTFYMAGTGYNSVFVGSNTYITFGAGASIYSGLSISNPSVPKFFFGSADNSYQRISTFTYRQDYVRIRYEGTAATSGTLGLPNIVLEITLFNRDVTGGNSLVELLVGSHNRTGGTTFVSSATGPTAYLTYTISQNQSYIFQGNNDGTSWSLLTGYNVVY
jgi:hypothetical protein